MLITARHFSLSSAKLIQSIFLLYTSLRFILTISSHLLLVLLYSLLSLRSLTRTLNVLLFPSCVLHAPLSSSLHTYCMLPYHLPFIRTACSTISFPSYVLHAPLSSSLHTYCMLHYNLLIHQSNNKAI